MTEISSIMRQFETLNTVQKTLKDVSLKRMMEKGYEWESSFHHDFMGKPNQYYFAFKKGTRSFAGWGDTEDEALTLAAARALAEENAENDR